MIPVKLLLIEDDVTLSETLQTILVKKGYEVLVANLGKIGLQMASASRPDLILLDIMLPDMDGWRVCSQLRKMSETTFIMILTGLSASENVVKGLNLGADDYIVKPIGTAELLARIRALLRRLPHHDDLEPGLGACNGHHRRPVLMYHDLKIDLDKHEVSKSGRMIDLSPTEFNLLSVLVRNQGRVLPHDFLVREVWGPPAYSGQLDSLRLYIRYLRQKLETESPEASLIQSEWGVGYRFG